MSAWQMLCLIIVFKPRRLKAEAPSQIMKKK